MLTQQINIAIIEDDEEFRSSFEAFCRSSKRLDCVFAVDSTEKFVKYYSAQLKIDVAIVDLGLPGLDGMEAIKYINRLSPETKIIVLTVHKDYDSTFQAIRNGAIGYLVKNLTFEEIEEYIFDLQGRGKVPLSPQIARRILKYFQVSDNSKKLSAQNTQLTPKEILVIKHFVTGKTYKETAQLMSITENGIRYHIRNIYKKLQIKSKADLLNLYVDGFFSKMFLMF